MLDLDPNDTSRRLYKSLINLGIPEEQTEAIRKAAFNYFEATYASYYKEHTKFLRAIMDCRITATHINNNLNLDKLSRKLYKSQPLYKQLVSAGVPEAKAEVIQDTLFNYFDTINSYDMEYVKKSLRIIVGSGSATDTTKHIKLDIDASTRKLYNTLILFVGLSEPEADAIQNTAYNYVKAVHDFRDEEREKLFCNITILGLTKHETELVVSKLPWFMEPVLWSRIKESYRVMHQ